ncbi:MAG: hypothetical protein IIA14_16395 [SAR324 cluster bacterium]|nr:hypothetical protein [SAR324 cluster bacterium]
MNPEESAEQTNIIHPPRPLAKKYFEPILYLADRMAAADGEVVAKETKIIDSLAKAATMEKFRTNKGYRNLTQKKACELLDIEAAKRGALVILSLVLKSDLRRSDSEQEYFRRIRTLLATDAVTVPVELETHKKLALEYLTQ